MSLYALSIKNFRSHEMLHMAFHWGVNAIVGLPDSGKTNILRAMDWVIRNRPLGFRFHSNFSRGPTMVSITTLDDPEGAYGWQVRFAKDKHGAEYRLEDGRTSEPLSAVGASVPDRVQEILNINELNFQKQLDKPFLICDTPAEVTRVLNRVTRLEKVDEVVSSITTSINSTNKRVRMLQLSIEDKERELLRYEKLQAFEDAVVELESLEKRRVELAERKESLHACLKNHADNEKKKKQYAALDTLEQALGNLQEADDAWYEVREKTDRLRVVTKQASSVDREVGELRRDITSKIKELSTFVHSMRTCPFCRMCKTPMKDHNVEELLQEV